MIDLAGFALGLWALPPSHRSYRPPKWPPPRNWVVSENRDGSPLSEWGHAVWDFSPWAGKVFRLNFEGAARKNGPQPLDPANADLMRRLTTWRMWGPRALRSPVGLKTVFFNPIRRILALCNENGVLASELMRFPRLVDRLPEVIAASNFKQVLVELHRIWDAREEIGFFVIDQGAIKRLMEAASDYDGQQEQTPYIPPRIWLYQLRRLRECIDDFLANEQQVKACFDFCVQAYAQNNGSLEAAVSGNRSKSRNPFLATKEGYGSRTGCSYLGEFSDVAQRFGISELLQRWVRTPARGLGVPQFSAYMSLVQYAGLGYITNFTLQRISEAASLRADCLMWEMDPQFGRVPIVCGETTKTDPDSDARWPTSPSVERAISAMSAIARMRMRCAVANSKVRPSGEDRLSPYLFDRAHEPWGGRVRDEPYSIRPSPQAYGHVLRMYPGLLDIEQLRITEHDLRVARMLNPGLSEEKGFAIGQVWPLAWHQLRRTGAVNMFASGVLSDSTIQFLMKHASRLMPLYYGRGYTRLHLNEEVEGMVIGAMYESMAHHLKSALGARFVSPLGEERKQTIVVNLVGQKDFNALVGAGRRGDTSFREIRLGGCTKRDACSYGGIESVARCGGGDGDGPCADALFDRRKAPAVAQELEHVKQVLAASPVATPRQRALLAERKAMENFLNVVRS